MTRARVLVIGASGMLGHEVARILSVDHEVVAAARRTDALADLAGSAEIIALEALDAGRARRLLAHVRPHVVLNAAGIVKQRPEARSEIPTISVNSLWPHVLAEACESVGSRLIQPSTDCVFSGLRGHYSEADACDATDLYGRSKVLGEIADQPHVLTIRTSFIGWQIGKPSGLLGWFAGHRSEPMMGYTRAIFSGLSTTTFGHLMRDVLIPGADLTGLWHVAAAPIDKYSLLMLLAEKLGWHVDIMPVAEPAIDRSLDGRRFNAATGWSAPTWEAMLGDLAATFALYEGR